MEIIYFVICFRRKKIKIYKSKILNYISSTKYFAGVSIVNGILLLKVLVKDITEIRVLLKIY